ncbi:MAG: hypothetical protein KF819_32150 [Labilithrix sp.]|nr:hypothetical protein [Labilithrix sp.]
MIGAAAASALVFGCAQIIGASEQFALAVAPDAASVDVAVTVAEVPEAGDPNACPGGQKRCNGACVPKSEPKYGCAAESCEPCSLPNTLTNQCTPEGLCRYGSCKQGWGACGSPTDGCIGDLASPNTCNGCDKPCGVGQVCNPSGCGASCDVGLTNCNSSCVNVATSSQYCGGDPVTCAGAKACPSAANGDPKCEKGVCSVMCRDGFGHCDGTTTGPCVALQIFYFDADKDGFGDVNKAKAACNAQQAGEGYVAIAGDCHDGNANVKPGQQQYFGAPYARPDGKLSYDYDCSGVETEAPGVVHYRPCSSSCSEAGLVPAASGRTELGVNDYCGSTTRLSCARGGASLEPASHSVPQAAPGLKEPVVAECALGSSQVPPNPCR